MITITTDVTATTQGGGTIGMTGTMTIATTVTAIGTTIGATAATTTTGMPIPGARIESGTATRNQPPGWRVLGTGNGSEMLPFLFYCSGACLQNSCSVREEPTPPGIF